MTKNSISLLISTILNSGTHIASCSAEAKSLFCLNAKSPITLETANIPLIRWVLN
uniref:Uncharacterized protein n=1 Tax=Arundo donax TaxID=35708 RepID=A0A0A9GFS5_ARUDO